MAENDKEHDDPPEGENVGEKRRKQILDPNAPSRPLSAFFWFSNDERRKVRRSNPEYGLNEVAKELAKRWAEADSEIKAKCEAIAEKDKVRYEKEMAIYMKSNPALQQAVSLSDNDDDDDQEGGEHEYMQDGPLHFHNN